MNNKIPVSQSLEFKTHLETVDKEFSFLTGLGFLRIKNDFTSREFWTVYSKGPIDIEIMFEMGSLPFVTIRNNELKYDESQGLDNRDSIEDFNNRARTIRQNSQKRREPMSKTFMEKWLNKNDPDFTELDKDYEEFGKQEHIEYLQVAALTVRQNLELKKGKLKDVRFDH